jgi:hypothetical protein
MSWRCPACRTVIRHREFEDQPRVGVRYHCHVCRLELEQNPETHRLDMPPWKDAKSTAFLVALAAHPRPSKT